MRRRLGVLFEVRATESEFRAGPAAIAGKVNQIESPLARLYFLRLIHDVHLREYRRLGDDAIFGYSQQEPCRARFQPVYDQLARDIRIDGRR